MMKKARVELNPLRRASSIINRQDVTILPVSKEVILRRYKTCRAYLE